MSCNSSSIDNVQSARELLEKANSQMAYSTFTKFYNLYSQLPEETKDKIQLNEEIYNLTLKYLDKISNEQPTDSLLLTYHTIFKYFKDNAEGSEIAAENFSDYFIKDLQNSLKALAEINDDKIQKELISQIMFVEGRDKEIIDYIESNHLTDKNYYKLFLDYKYW